MHTTLHEARVLETPAAVMRTYASPTTPAPADVAVWRTEMTAGTSGPPHAVDVDQVVVVVEGSLVVETDGSRTVVPAGDSITLPASAERRLTAGDTGVGHLV